MPEAADARPVAVVTGGNGFIGSAIVRRLKDSGHDVVVLDREGDVAVDLASEEDVRRAARGVLVQHGRCDVLVHAAAAFERATLEALEPALLRRVMAVNLESVLWLLQEFRPGMTTRSFGRVVLIVSDTFWDPPPVTDLLPYVASKGALIGAARSLARSLGREGITVNCVAPGMTPPPVDVPGLGKEISDAVVARQAIPRVLVPDDVAEAVAFLVSPGAQAVTGQTICPDGGLVMR